MASICNSLNIGYSGLNAAQVGIDTTGRASVSLLLQQYRSVLIPDNVETEYR